MLNDDYKEMLQCLLEERVGFLLLGACPVIARNDLITNKRAVGRAQDLADVERLTGTEDGD